MKILFIVLGVALAAPVVTAAGQEGATPKEAKAKATTATFLMTGLHCPPCTTTVESSLRKAKGVRSVKVDWKTKMARVEFDETVLPAQRVSQIIAGTPHVMGAALHYGGWLALRAPEINDEASGQRAEQALRTVAGVKGAKAYPAQHALAANFAEKGELTTRQLIEALRAAGFQAENY